MTLLDDPVATRRTLVDSPSAFGLQCRLHPAASTSAGWTEPAPMRVAVHDGPPWLNRVAHRLALCAGPQDNGDGTWQAGISDALLHSAVRVLADTVDVASPEPNVVCTADRTILFSWHVGGWDVEVEVAPDTTEAWAHERSTGRELVGTPESFEVDLRSFIANLGSGD